jgi:hypothetical protein
MGKDVKIIFSFFFLFLAFLYFFSCLLLNTYGEDLLTKGVVRRGVGLEE